MSSSDADLSGQRPAGLRAVVDRWRRLEVTHATDLSLEIERREREVLELGDSFDAVHLLGQLTLSEVVARDPDSYVENESVRSPLTVELLAALLL